MSASDLSTVLNPSSSLRARRDPTAHAIYIPELIGIICGMVAKDDAARAARVCKTWNEVALDHVWRELTDILSLLELLHPLTETTYGWDFAESSNAYDWTTYYRHARRVIALHHPGNISLSRNLIVQLTTSLAARPERFLLPRTRFIQWTASDDKETMHLLLFVSPSLSTLDVRTEFYGPEVERRMLRAVCERSVSLRSIRNYPTYQVDNTEDAAFWAKEFPVHLERHVELARLSILRYPTSLKAIDAICEHHPNLLVLHASLKLPQEEWKKVGLPTSIGFLSQVRTVALQVQAESFRPLEGSLGFNAIIPLLNCHSLSRLLLSVDSYEKSLSLETENIKAMGSAWPAMQVLELSGGDMEGGTPLGRLSDFAAAFGTTIKHLAHHFTLREGLPDAHATNQQFSFPMVINVGPMVINQGTVIRVAEFVGALSPAGVELSDDLTTAWDDRLDDELSQSDFCGVRSRRCADVMEVINALYPQSNMGSAH